jgi:hypothetical protein
VTDYRLYQAFAERDDVVVWERLPAHLEASPLRDYPASRTRLRAALLDTDALFVMSPRSYDQLTRIMRSSEGPEWVTCTESEVCVVAHLASSASLCPTVDH